MLRPRTIWRFIIWRSSISDMHMDLKEFPLLVYANDCRSVLHVVSGCGILRILTGSNQMHTGTLPNVCSHAQQMESLKVLLRQNLNCTLCCVVYTPAVRTIRISGHIALAVHVMPCYALHLTSPENAFHWQTSLKEPVELPLLRTLAAHSFSSAINLWCIVSYIFISSLLFTDPKRRLWGGIALISYYRVSSIPYRPGRFSRGPSS